MVWAPDYATSDELKAFLRIPLADTEDDALVSASLTAASRAIDQATNRQFGQVTPVEARLFTARYDKFQGRWVIDTDDISDDTGLLVDVDDDDDGTYDASVDSFWLVPINGEATGRPWTSIVVKSDSANTPSRARHAVQVTALWGWSSVPGTIKAATVLQAARFFARRNAPFGVAGSPDMGSELRLLSKVDPDVAVQVRPYAKQWGAV